MKRSGPRYAVNWAAFIALKRLRGGILEDDSCFMNGMADLANETLFLGSIDHPYIIKLRGIGAGDMCHKDFFIILDRLYDTLASRLVKWKAEQKKACGLKKIFRKRACLRRRIIIDPEAN